MGPELGYWLFSVCLLIAPVVAYRLLTRSDPNAVWDRLGGWVAAHAAAEPEEWDDDHVAAELAAEVAAVLRRERLVRDLQRVQHLITTDAWMPAVRQIGNRMAYEQLLHDVRLLPEPAFPTTLAGASPGWGVPDSSGRATVAVASSSGQSADVETIDFRLWR